MRFTRKNIRLPGENYRGKRIYFLTLCCEDRKPLLANQEVVLRLVGHLRSAADRQGFVVHAYCFMPDHLHLLAEGRETESDLLDFVKHFKQLSAFEYRQRSKRGLWQFKFYDHILRRDEEMDAVAWYIWMNPVRKGLCRDPHEFPYSGSFTLPWQAERPPHQAWSPPWRAEARLKRGVPA